MRAMLAFGGPLQGGQGQGQGQASLDELLGKRSVREKVKEEK